VVLGPDGEPDADATATARRLGAAAGR
jgi:hypothetical protein